MQGQDPLVTNNMCNRLITLFLINRLYLMGLPYYYWQTKPGNLSTFLHAMLWPPLHQRHCSRLHRFRQNLVFAQKNIRYCDYCPLSWLLIRNFLWSMSKPKSMLKCISSCMSWWLVLSWLYTMWISSRVFKSCVSIQMQDREVRERQRELLERDCVWAWEGVVWEWMLDKVHNIGSKERTEQWGDMWCVML